MPPANMMILLGKNKTRYSAKRNVIGLKSFEKSLHYRYLILADLERGTVNSPPQRLRRTGAAL